ncbi:MAG: hypothetical protein K8S54_07170 [Spirochaetia bacterium]|nr:hypothetical protein [Spirochaetia bacterium]
MKIKDAFLNIPLQYRAALYSGPFFVLWILGYAMDQGERSRVAAGRGFVMLTLFLAYHAVVLLAFEIVKSFLSSNFALDIVHFALKSAGGLTYLVIAGYLGIQEARNVPAATPGIDSRARYLETALGR